MSSPPAGLRSEPSTTPSSLPATAATAAAAAAATPTPTPTSTASNSYTNLPNPTSHLPAAPWAPPPALAPAPVLSRTPSPAKQKLGSRPAHPVGDDSNVSEAETVVLGENPNDGTRSVQRPSLENGNKRAKVGGGENQRKGRGDKEGEEGPRKKRKRSLSRRGCTTDAEEGDDARFSSGLSSAHSSRHASPRRRVPEGPKSHLRDPQVPYRGGRKRKLAVTDAGTTSDDEPVEYRSRPRRRRTSTLDSPPRHPRRSARESSPYLPRPRTSPDRSTKTKPIHHKRQRKIPPPLEPRDKHHSDAESSTSSSLQGSPNRRRRLHSAARTPGSPVSMSHKPKRDTAGRTHLHRACGRGSVTEVASILEQGTDLINAEDNAGYMPIHEASLNGHIDIVKLLVEHDASFDAQSSFDLESPLLDAVENSHVSVVKYLLELGADPRKRDKQGRTCLDANQEGSESAEVRDEIENLLRNAISKQRAQRPSDDENRASVPADRESRSSRDPSVASPIHMSPPAPSMTPAANIRRRNARAEQSRKDLLWLDAGKGSLAKLREKAREGDLQMVHALLETGLKPDTESLVAAIKGGHTELVSLMLAYSAEVDPPPGQADKEGSRRKREVSMPIGEDTPMLAAIGRGNVEILRYLLNNGVDPKRRDSRGKSYIDIAREREGEYWQEEVQLLKEAWQKAETKSPSRRRPSPKSSPNKQRRNSTASTSRNPSRLSTLGTKDQKALKRSASANPSHHLNEEVSDREPHTEAPKSRSAKPKRSDLDSTHSSALKKRRRLVSGKVRDEEAARVGDMTPVPERGSSSKRIAAPSDKPSAKIDRFDAAGPVKEDTPIKKPKIEVSEDIDMANVPPLERPKIHSTRERHSAAVRSNSISLEGKRPLSKNHSPPRAPRSEEQRRRREEFPDDRQLRRDTDNDPRRIREGRRRDSSVSSESTRKREDPHRPVREESDKWRQTEDRRRLREKDPEDKDMRERRVKKEVAQNERKTDREKKPREDDKKKSREDDQADQCRPEEVARELLRKKHLTKELHSIQKKAAKEAAVQRDNEITIREQELRRLREEEQERQRMIREREKKEQEEREAREKAERELREKEVREREELERLAREKEARERAEREEKERLEREKAEQERLAREKAERERLAREKAEQERIEKERREREEWEAKQRELQLQEERRRQEEDRRAREAERRRLEDLQRQIAAEAALRRQKEEAERQRLELERLEAEQKQRAAEEERKRREFEKIEREARDRRVAEELQQQIAREQAVREAARIQSLPYALRIAAQNEPRSLSTWPELYGDYIPLFSAILPSTRPITENATPNGVSNRLDEWVLNVQVALAFGTSDLHLSTYSQLERRTATEHERWRMWSCMNGVLCKEMVPDKSMKDRLAHMAKEKQKFMTMQPVFWVKYEEILYIVSSEPRFKPILEYPISTIKCSMDPPIPCKGNTSSLISSFGEGFMTRTKRLDATQTSPALAVSTLNKDSSSNSSNDVRSESMPPPQQLPFGNNGSSG